MSFHRLVGWHHQHQWLMPWVQGEYCLHLQNLQRHCQGLCSPLRQEEHVGLKQKVWIENGAPCLGYVLKML